MSQSAQNLQNISVVSPYLEGNPCTTRQYYTFLTLLTETGLLTHE